MNALSSMDKRMFVKFLEVTSPMIRNEKEIGHTKSLHTTFLTLKLITSARELFATRPQMSRNKSADVNNKEDLVFQRRLLV